MGLVVCCVVRRLDTHRTIYLPQPVFDLLVLLVFRKLSLRVIRLMHLAIESTQPKMGEHVRWICCQDLL